MAFYQSLENTFGGAFVVDGLTELQLAISLHSFEEACGFLQEETIEFEMICQATADTWEKYLSAVEIEAKDEQVALAGGKERMIALLDEFFGYTREPVKI